MTDSTNWQRMREMAPFAPQAFRFVQEGLQHTLSAASDRSGALDKATGGVGEDQPDDALMMPADLLGELFDLDEAQLAELAGSEAQPMSKHVSGQELCLGLRSLAVKKYGLLARTVLDGWGVKSTEDFGKIVYAMVDAGLLRTSEADSMEDFRGVYEFDEAFDSLPAPAGDCAARGSTCSDGRGTGDVG